MNEANMLALARGKLGEAGVPGAAVAVIVDGEMVVAAGVGKRDAGHTEPLLTDAVFPLYSVTKTVIATLVVGLVDDGDMELDAPIGTTLPKLPLPEAVTWRRLLNHTAGIGDYGGMEEYARAVREVPERPWSDAEFLERVLGSGLAYTPGEGWGYSNVGYLILRLALTARTGRSLAALVAERIAAPLGLERTRVVETLEDMVALTPGYSGAIGDAHTVADVRHRYHPGWVSHGLLASTAAETAMLIEALMRGRLTSAAGLQAMLDAVPVPAGHPHIRRPGYGLGLMLDRDPEAGLVAGHSGGGPGYTTAAFHMRPLSRPAVTSVALANRDTGDLATDIAFALAREAVASA